MFLWHLLCVHLPSAQGGCYSVLQFYHPLFVFLIINGMQAVFSLLFLAFSVIHSLTFSSCPSFPRDKEAFIGNTCVWTHLIEKAVSPLLKKAQEPISFGGEKIWDVPKYSFFIFVVILKASIIIMPLLERFVQITNSKYYISDMNNVACWGEVCCYISITFYY